MAEYAFVALGSNLGDRSAFLATGRKFMAGLPETEVCARSVVEETDPVGETDQGRFLNQMVLLRTGLTPAQLLEALQEGEAAAGRVRKKKWGPRTLDLDLVRYGDVRVETERLTLPHPALPDRPFWHRELAELFPMSLVPGLDPTLPSWAQVNEGRRLHIDRVAGLMAAWAVVMHRSPAERRRWLKAAYLHDALRDAPPTDLESLCDVPGLPPALWHGPAAASRAADEGEHDDEVLDAVRYHSVGSSTWGQVGKVLYLADYLEPGRSYKRKRRAKWAAAVPRRMEAVLRSVIAMRLRRAIRSELPLALSGVELWNSVVTA